MALDVAVLDEHYRYEKHLHLGKEIQGLLFRKLVTLEDYPALGKAKDDSEDITFTPEEIPGLQDDLVKLEKFVKKTKKMSDEVKKTCLDFVASMKDICETALRNNKNVEFIAGE